MEFEAPPFYGIDAKLRDFVSEFVRTGTQVYRLNIFVEHFGQKPSAGGQTLQAYALGVLKQLQDYQLRLLKFNQIVQRKRTIMNSILTARKQLDSSNCKFSLIELNTYMYNSMDKIHTLAAICLCSGRNTSSWVEGEEEYDLQLQLQYVLNRQNWLSRFPRGMQLLSYLFYVVASRQNEAQSQALVSRLFDRACEPLFAFLYRYIYSGRVVDPCNQYFIIVKQGTGNQKFKGYSLDQKVESIPAFLLKSIKNISVCGMLLNVLRQCSKHQYLALCEGRDLKKEAPQLKIFHDIQGMKEFESNSIKFYESQHQRLAQLQIEHQRAQMKEEIQLRKAIEAKLAELAQGRLSIVREKIEAKQEERRKAMEYRKALDDQVKMKEQEKKEKQEQERRERELMDEQLMKQRELEKMIADNMRKKLEEILKSQPQSLSQRATRSTQQDLDKLIEIGDEQGKTPKEQDKEEQSSIQQKQQGRGVEQEEKFIRFNIAKEDQSENEGIQKIQHNENSDEDMKSQDDQQGSDQDEEEKELKKQIIEYALKIIITNSLNQIHRREAIAQHLSHLHKLKTQAWGKTKKLPQGKEQYFQSVTLKCNKVFRDHGILENEIQEKKISNKGNKEEVPLSISVRQAIQRPVMRQLRVANQCVLLMLFRDYELESKLKELRNVYFFYKADLMNGFLQELAYKNKASSSLPARSAFNFGSGGIHALNSSLREALRRFRPNDNLPFHFEVGKKDGAWLEQNSILNPFYMRKDIKLMYENANFPIKIIITKDALDKYNRVFQFLLQLKWVSLLLKQIWEACNSKTLRRMKGFPLRQLQQVSQLRMKMAHFVKIVEQFVLQENVGAAWDKFMQQMCEVQSLKQLFGLHDQYLRRVARNCFLESASARIQEVIFKIFLLVQSFRKFVAALSEKESIIELHPNQEPLQLLDEQQFASVNDIDNILTIRLSLMVFQVVKHLQRKSGKFREFFLSLDFNYYYSEQLDLAKQ